MQLDNSQEEIQLLELRIRAVNEEFDNAIKKDMVLGDAKRLFHELKILSAKLLDLRKQHASNER